MPFSLPSSAALCRCWGSWAFTPVSTSSCLLHLSTLRVCLMDCCSCPVSPRSPFFCSISAVSGSVTCSEKVCSSSMAIGFNNPRPPWQAGSARSSRSTSDRLSLPVRAGRNCWRMVSLRGCISGDIPSAVLRKYIQWSVRPWVNAEKAAWARICQ